MPLVYGEGKAKALNRLPREVSESSKQNNDIKEQDRRIREGIGSRVYITLRTVNLGLLYAGQGRMAEAEAMYKRVLKGRLKLLEPQHPSTLQTVDALKSGWVKHLKCLCYLHLILF